MFQRAVSGTLTFPKRHDEYVLHPPRTSADPQLLELVGRDG